MFPLLAKVLLAGAPLAADAGSLDANEAWHAQRSAALSAEDGWLTVVGLFWLDEKESRAGSAPTAELQLPGSAPPLLGVFARKGPSVEFRPQQGVVVTVDGKAFAGGALRADTTGAPTLLRTGTLTLSLIERSGRLGLRVRDSNAEARRRFFGVPRYPYAPGWVKTARLEPAKADEELFVPNVLGSTTRMRRAGRVVFTHEGRTHALAAAQEGDELFIIFADASNRRDTYGAGRFLYAPVPAKGSTSVALDFNRAVNPPCAFTAFATCPLPPKENRLPISVEAGEKRYAKPH